jgi:hypothetical protein
MLKITFQKYEDVKSVGDYDAVTEINNFHADRAAAREPFAYADLGYKGRVIDGQPVYFLSNINIWDRRKNNVWVVLAHDEASDSYAFEEGTPEYQEFLNYAIRQFNRLIGRDVGFNMI